MSTIDELATLIRAGLDEDEETARTARPGPWISGASKPHLVDGVVYGQSEWPPGNLSHTCDTGYAGKYGAPNAEHIVRHDPARALAEVAAKRSVLDEILGWEHRDDARGNECTPHPAGGCYCGRDDQVLAVLECLAAPYQERP